ncbi:MAG: VOC family protein [Candidatus Andersenbacteria bacterium]
MKLHHVAITVSNLEKSTDFYTKNFGLQVVKEFARPENGWKARFLQADNIIIELFEFEESGSQNDNEDISIVGIRHIAFSVEDIDEEVKRLSHLEFTPVHEGASGRRLTFTQDPDGVQIELYEDE